MIDHDIFTIVLRDINGKRTTLEFYGEHEVYEWAVNDMDSEEEILIVGMNGMCLYSALGTDRSLCEDDITGFFG